MKTKIIILLVFCLSCVQLSNLKAQQWMRSPYIDVNKKDLNFYDIQKAFNMWSADKDLSKIKGYKAYKRWEWFYGPRVFPTGEMPDPGINWKELRKFKTKNSAKKNLKTSSIWTSIAPVSIPPSPDPTSIHGMGRINCITFHPTDTNTFWIGASQGGVWKTTDGGQTWVVLTDDIPLLRISDIAVDPVNPDIMYIATGDIDYIGFNTIETGRIYQFGMGILKSTDAGVTWDTTGLSFNLTDEQSSLIRKIIINPDSTNKIIAGGADGIYKSSDAGATWTKKDSSVIIDMDANPLNNNTIFASTFCSSVMQSKAKVIKSTDFGDTWTVLNTGIPLADTVQRIEVAIAPSDTNFIYALTCGNNGGLYAFYNSIDAGDTWQLVGDTNSGATYMPNVLGWADGGYFHLPGYPVDNAGQGTYDLTLIVNPNDPGKIYTGGVNMWGSEDTGKTWNFVSMWVNYFGPSLHADQHCSAINPLTEEYFQANDGGLFKTDTIKLGDINAVLPCVNFITQEITPGCYTLPTNWTDLTGGLHITEFYRMGGCRDGANVIIAGSQDNGTYLYNDGNWISAWGGDGMEAMIDHHNPSIIYATNYNGALNRSTDGGQNFTSNLETPITDAGEHGDWVTPYVMDPDNSNIIYTAFNNIWKSEDQGTSWTKISDIASNYSFKALTVANSNYIYAARPKDIYRTSDGGTTWSSIKMGLPINDDLITYIAVSAEDPLTLWVTFSGYDEGEKVYKSTDGGDSWNNISYNLPNVAANCIVHQAGHTSDNVYLNGLYVGTDIGVFYTNDSLLNSSAKWIDFNNGLPNVVVNELEIHYGSQKLRAATYGRGLWETGLYISSYDVNIGMPQYDNNNANLKVFPNPNNGNFMVKANVKKKENVLINLFTLTGDKVLTINDNAKGAYNKQIDISEFTNGIYILQITIADTHYTTKIVKQ